MKRLIALVLSSLMLLSVMVISTSAAGQLIFNDDFSDGYKPRHWILQGTKFAWDEANGCLAGYSDAVVAQTNFQPPYNMKWDDFYTSVDFQIRADDDKETWEEGDLTYAGLWYRDLFENEGNAVGAAYHVMVCVQTGEMHVAKSHEFIYVDENGINKTHVMNEEIIAGPVATSVSELEIGDDAAFYNIGLRVTDGVMQCYFEGELVIELEASEDDEKLGGVSLEGIDATVGTQRSPILLWNTGNYIAFDNFEVWTADYDFTRVMYGDANGDGKVNITDASVIMKSVAGWIVDVASDAADANADGKVNLADASLILKYAAGWDVVLGPAAE